MRPYMLNQIGTVRKFLLAHVTLVLAIGFLARIKHFHSDGKFLVGLDRQKVFSFINLYHVLG